MPSIEQGEIGFDDAMRGLLPKQKEFLRTAARNAAYVGGQGAGKSVSLCLSAILNAHADPNGFSLIGRLHMPSLKDSTMKSFLELTKSEWGEWKPSESRFLWKNGHQTVFKHLDMSDPKIVGHIKSMNLSAAYVDEATEINEEIYFLLIGRLRRKTAPRHIIRLSSNPAGHDWVWRHFFDPNRNPKFGANHGVTAASTENTHLPKEYIENMLATYPPDWADRFIHGYFNDFSDLVYKEFSEPMHVWDSRRHQDFFSGGHLPPANWPVIVGIDIGCGTEGDPWALAFIAVSPDGRLFQFAEVYGGSLLVEEVAAQYQELMRDRYQEGMAYDYADRQSAMELAEHDVLGQDAVKDIQPGLFKCAQYFHVDPRLEHPFSGKMGSPRYFVASHCIQTINALSSYKWAKDRSGNNTNEPSHEYSHCPDAIRYAIHTFRPLPEKVPVLAKWQNPTLNELSRMYWRDAEKHAREGESQTLKPKRWGKPRGLRFQRPNSVLVR